MTFGHFIQHARGHGTGMIRLLLEQIDHSRKTKAGAGTLLALIQDDEIVRRRLTRQQRLQSGLVRLVSGVRHIRLCVQNVAAQAWWIVIGHALSPLLM